MAFTDNHYFVDGALRDTQNVIVAAAFHEREDISATEIWFQNGEKWLRYQFAEDFVCGIAYDVGQGKLVAVAKGGHTAEFAVGGGSIDSARLKQSISRRTLPKGNRHGPMTRVRWLGGTAYACGWRGKVFRLGQQGWISHDNQIPRDVRANLQDLAIDGDGTIYVVGMKGAAYRFLQDHWSAIDIPTSSHLYCATRLGNGEVVVGGANGLLLRGSGDRWQVIENHGFDQNIWCVQEYNEKIWITAGDDFLGLIENGHVMEVKPKPGVSTKSNRICCAGGVLFACGPQYLFTFDGGRWNEILLPSPTRSQP